MGPINTIYNKEPSKTKVERNEIRTLEQEPERKQTKPKINADKTSIFHSFNV